MVKLLPRIKVEWIRENFTIYQNRLHLIRPSRLTIVGDPMHSQRAAQILPVLEYEELVNVIKQLHEDLGHASVGMTTREVNRKYWHPELMLAVFEVIRNCRSCQLTKAPDPALGNMTPIQPAPPLTRWGIDHTQAGPHIILHAIEYATGWLESRVVPSTSFKDTAPLLMHIIHCFGAPKQLISDNVGCFSGQEAQNFMLSTA